MSLPEQIQKIKGFFRSREESVQTVLHVILLIGIGSGGYLIGAESQSTEIDSGVAVFSPFSEALPAARLTAGQESALKEGSGEGMFVASGKGTKYHRIDCSGAKTIKEENRVYFESEDAAQKAGYTPAANCPGLR